MSPSDKEQFLAHHWLQGLDPAIIADVASCLHLCRHRNGAALYALGDPPECLYLVVSGKVRLGGQNARGDDMLLHIVDVGAEVGMLSLLDGKARRQLAHCVGDTSLLVLRQADFLSLMKRHSALQWRIIQELCATVRTFCEVTEDTVLLRLSARLAKRLLTLMSQHGTPGTGGIVINLPLSHQELAKMLGVTRQSIGLVMSHWKQKGWVQQRYRQLVVSDPTALEAVIVSNSDE
ncbi:Crp/Fnr family transcriptional regulator [Cupriavidus sp. TMH.W2]|uniref:Crp/Fnr family transcriptional regulator n=1 Tax=Cupriavidus sp. TMH.W2 TaxID=3434465 RepID=UPI003D774A00